VVAVLFAIFFKHRHERAVTVQPTEGVLHD